MDTDEVVQRYQELLKKFDRNGEDRLELENERNEILNHKSAAVREKWLRQLGKCARGSNGLEQKFANESIQETIDLCHQHLKGLESDLTRLEDTREKLLLELEDLKSRANCDLTTDLNNNNVEKPVARIIITTHSSRGKRRRNSSKDEPLSPTGLERRYELQRKIDEELRKLQLAERMADDQITENIQESNGVAESSFELKNDLCQQSQEPVECGNDVNGLQLNNKASNNEDEKSTRDTSATAFGQIEIEHEHTGTNQIDDVNEFHKDKSDIVESHDPVTVVATDFEGDITDSSPTQKVESDSIPHSSTVTSSTTITIDTSLQQSNSTIQNNGEPIPNDEIVSETSQNMEELTIEQTKSSENTASEGTSSIDLNTQESVERHEQPDVVQGTSVDPEDQEPAIEEDVKVTNVTEVSIPIEMDDRSRSGEEIVEDVEQNPGFSLIETTKHDDVSHVVNINRVANLSEEVVNTPPPSPVKSVADEASDSEIVVTENSTMEGKPSSDDEDYSGCDIDMGTVSSYQGVVNVPEEIESVNCEVTAACDDDNNPIFVDVKYSVGEQITVAQDDGLLDIPSPSVDNPEEASAPWDSSGQFIENAASATNESIPSNKADSESRSSRSSISDANEDADTLAIAEQTVSNAIQSAYEIYAAEYDKHPDFDTNEVEDISDAQSTSEVVEKSGDVISLHNTTEGIDTVELSSPSCSGNEGVETNSSELVITTLHEENDNSQQEMDSVTENGKEDTTHNSTEKSIEKSSTAVINGNQLNSDLSHAESLLATKVLSQESDSIDQVIEDTAAAQDTVDVTDAAAKSQDTSEQEVNIVKEEQQSNVTVEMASEPTEPTIVKSTPEKITYNPALSQRNTEATKWFGQPTSENKIWMKPSGRLDSSAEMERKRLIKAMTRRNNPNLVPKWEPPKEKDFTEDLDEKHKESLKKYEERRQNRITIPTFKDGLSETESVLAESETASASTKELPRENIVTESVVHSRDAISVWESRLSEKHHKEELEKQRLSVGKQNKSRPRTTSEVVTTPVHNISSPTNFTDAILPSSEHIERESVDISQVRNRWKDMDKSSKLKQSEPVPKKINSSRRSTFTVNTAPAFRSSQTPSAAIHQQDNNHVVSARNSGLISVTSSHSKESHIDREIRESAEREEKWKQEQWEKMSEISTVSSEDAHPDRSVKTTNESISHQGIEINNVQHDISTSITESHNQTNGHKELDSESLSSYGSGVGNVPSSPRSSVADNQDKIDVASRSSYQEYTDSGIDECNAAGVDTNASKSVLPEKAITGTVAPSSLDVGKTSDTTTEDEAVFRRKRISSLTHAVTPRGWEPNKNRIGPVSPISPLQRSFSRTEVKASPTSPLHPVEEIPKVKTDVIAASSPEHDVAPQVTAPEKLKDTLTSEISVDSQSETKPTIIPAKGDENTPKIPENKKGGPVFVRKWGGPVGVSSSKSQLQTIMAREMEDAAAREAEWRNKQLELVNKGVDLSAHPIVHSTREIRTPTGHSAPPPVNSHEQTNDVNLRRPVKSLFDDGEDENNVDINADISDEFKKREVVKAMRVPKRKSYLAMRWEEGQYQNTAPDDEN